MKQVTAISLALLVFAVAAKDVLTWASFKVNQEYIAKTLCINRDMPEVMCNGKCQLTKKIAESKEKKPAQAPMPQPDEQKQVLDLHEIGFLELKPNRPSITTHLFAVQSFTAQPCAFDIFQPPRA